MFWVPWHQSMSTYSQSFFFQLHLEERWGIGVQGGLKSTGTVLWIRYVFLKQYRELKGQSSGRG